jgi:hypothetical protein
MNARRCTEERYRASCISKKLLSQDMKAGMLNDIEAARDVVAAERASCRGTLIGVIGHHEGRYYNDVAMADVVTMPLSASIRCCVLSLLL